MFVVRAIDASYAALTEQIEDAVVRNHIGGHRQFSRWGMLSLEKWRRATKACSLMDAAQWKLAARVYSQRAAGPECPETGGHSRG